MAQRQVDGSQAPKTGYVEGGRRNLPERDLKRDCIAHNWAATTQLFLGFGVSIITLRINVS
jgi:hypothetical protein